MNPSIWISVLFHQSKMAFFKAISSSAFSVLYLPTQTILLPVGHPVSTALIKGQDDACLPGTHTD